MLGHESEWGRSGWVIKLLIFFLLKNLLIIIKVKIDPRMEPQPSTSPIGQLRNLQSSIVEKLELLGQLNTEYRSKQQKQFLKIFLHVMDKMSNQLSQANEQYQNIDREIEKDQKCVELATKLSFFRNQALFLKGELDRTEGQIAMERQRQREIAGERTLLQSSLFRKSKQIFRYRAQARSLDRSEGIKTQINDGSPGQEKTGQLQLNLPKKQSFSQTKNTNMSHMASTTKNQPLQPREHRERSESPRNSSSSEVDFRAKAARIAREKKYLNSKTYYQQAWIKKNKGKPDTLEILR